MEEWKPVRGYEGYYEVSSLGRVRSVPRAVQKSNGVVQNRHEKIKALMPDADGYLTVNLSIGGASKRVPVHRLVAEAFVPGYFDGAEVNHIDCDRTNNSSWNLEWVTHRENINYSIKCGNHICVSDMTGENNPNFGNTTLHERYLSDRNLAKEKQGRPGAQNGKAIPVECIFTDGSVMQFSYCGECAAYLIEHGLVRGKSIAGISPYIARAARSGEAYSGMRFRQI